MEYLRQIEDDLQALGVEAKRKHPEIKDSADRALSSLKLIRETYVSDMMRKTGTATTAVTATNNATNKKKNNLPQSSDIIAPYILTCNYADASPKIVSLNYYYIRIIMV